MTNAIGTGTCNLTINVPLDERNELGRLATAAGQSIGDLMRRLTIRGLQAELIETESQLHREIGFISRDGETILLRRAESLRQTLRSIRETRKRYYGAALLMLFVAILVIGEKQDFRRCRRSRMEEERVEEVCEA